MANTKITFSGGPALEAALKELGDKAAGRLGTNAARAGARVLVNAAKAAAPVRTGALKQSLRVFDERSQSGGTERTAYAGTRLFYAYWVEFGRAHIRGTSFLRDAADTAWQDAVDKMKANLAAGIEREAAKYRGR